MRCPSTADLGFTVLRLGSLLSGVGLNEAVQKHPALVYRLNVAATRRAHVGPREFRVILLCSPMLLRAQRTATAARPTIRDICLSSTFSGLRVASLERENANPLPSVPRVINSTAKSSASLSKRRVAGIFIRRLCRAQRLSPCGLYRRQRTPVLVAIRGLKTFLSRKHGWSSMSTVSKRQLRISNRGDIEFLLRTGKSPGAKLSPVSSHQKDCWSASLSLLRCAKRNSRDRALCSAVLQLRRSWTRRRRARPRAGVGSAVDHSATHHSP